MPDYLNAGMGAVWVQPDGPNSEPLFLGCHDVADIVQPQGDITQRYCPSAVGPNQWNPGPRSKGPPGDVTTTLTTYVAVTRDYLQDVACPAAVHVHQSKCGRVNVFNNYDSGSLLYDADIISKTKTNTSMRETAEATEQSFDLSAPPPLSEYVKLQVTRQVTAETELLNDIAMMGTDQCWGFCGDTSTRCTDLVAVEGDPGGVSDILITTTGGNTWTAVAGPFPANDDIISVVTFQTDRDTTRILVVNGSAGAGGAEVSYSDDSGTTWTDVTVGAVVGARASNHGCLFAGDMHNIWLVDDSGDIWFCNDGGVTWTEQVTANANILQYVHFADENVGITVGITNTVLSTEDGGVHWTTETGPPAKAAGAIQSCACLDRNRWWIGYRDADLYFTNDGGATWTERALPFPSGYVALNSINDMNWFNHYHGVLSVAWEDGTERGALYVTHNGGFTWEIYEVADAYDGAGEPMAVIMCNERLVYNVGNIETTAQIITLAP